MQVALLVIFSAALTASFRFLGTPEFNNDHFVHLAAAQQVLFGEWPTRDFIDIGRPLQIVASAAAQRVIGHNLFAEALLVSAAFGIAAAFTAAIVFGLTGSLPVAAGAVIVEIVAFPRTYSYPKLLAIAAGLWVIACFLRRPGMLRQIMMAASVAIAFFFRHDLGLFVGVGGLVASMLAAPEASWRDRCRSAATFAGIVLAIVTPYLAYVQMNGGLSNYFLTALEQNQLEAGYVWPNPFAESEAWSAQLLYAFHLLPVVALGLCAVEWKRRRADDWRTPFLISVACVAIGVNFGLMRDLLRARIPDAVVPAVVLGAWFAHRAWVLPRRAVLLPAIGLLIGIGLALGDAANIGEIANRAGLDAEVLARPQQLPALFADRSAQLHDRFGASPSRAAAALRPFFEFLDRCTTEDHRLFLGGLIPEAAYLARRPFAGGGYEHYNFASPANQQRVIERLRAQLVPFALIPGGDAELADVPIVAGYLHERYVLLADFDVDGNEHIEVLVDRNVPPASRDAATGWPCFTAGGRA